MEINPEVNKCGFFFITTATHRSSVSGRLELTCGLFVSFQMLNMVSSSSR